MILICFYIFTSFGLFEFQFTLGYVWLSLFIFTGLTVEIFELTLQLLLHPIFISDTLCAIW